MVTHTYPKHHVTMETDMGAMHLQAINTQDGWPWPEARGEAKVETSPEPSEREHGSADTLTLVFSPQGL